MGVGVDLDGEEVVLDGEVGMAPAKDDMARAARKVDEGERCMVEELMSCDK